MIWLWWGCARTEPAIEVTLSPECPSYTSEAVGQLDASLVEVSGMVQGRRDPSVFWVHNDSGDAAQLYAIAPTGEKLHTYLLPGNATDWEDLAIGPDPETEGGAYLYIGDIGDNQQLRPDITIWRLSEPALGAQGETTSVAAEPLVFQYPNGAQNAEALLVDAGNADLYLLTKNDSGLSELYRGRISSSSTLEKVAELHFGGTDLPGSPKVTGASLSGDGTKILVRTYSSAYFWINTGDIAASFSAKPCQVPLETEAQGEAIAWTTEGSYRTVSEGNQPTIWAFHPSP